MSLNHVSINYRNGNIFKSIREGYEIKIVISDGNRLVWKTINGDYRSVLNAGSFAGRTTQSAKTDLNDFAFSPKWIYCMF